MLKFLELLELCVDLLVPLRLRGHVLERVEALVEAAVRRARRVYGLSAVKKYKSAVVAWDASIRHKDAACKGI